MIEEIVVESLNGYIKFVEDCSLEFSLSRGQSHDFPLLPGALRTSKSGNRIHSKMDINKFLYDFKSESIYYIDSASELNDSDNVVYAQHYGLPTYLLDFTYSHLVSLAFAVENIFSYSDIPDNENAVVWFVNPEQINFKSISNSKIQCISQINKDSFDTPVFIKSNKIHPRINAQNGIFLFFNEGNRAFETYSEYHEYMKKVIIPLSKCKKILCDLYKLGVRHSMLYPELPTVAKDILLKNEVVQFCKEEINP